MTDLFRVRLAICLIVAFALVSNLRLLGRAVRQFQAITSPDEITAYEARFRELRHALPAHARVGYVTDPAAEGPNGAGENHRLPFKRYVLTQYALLPAIVLRHREETLVVGNFSSAPDPGGETTRGLTLIRDYGDGVMLFRVSAE